MRNEAAAVFIAATSAVLVSCTTTTTPATHGSQAAVATVRLEEVEMTPVEMVLSQGIPAGTELQLRQEGRLRPVWVGVYQVTNITAQGVPEPLTLRDVPTLKDIQAQWGKYEQSGLMAIMKIATDLPAGTKLTVRGHKYDGLDPLRQRFTGREGRVWIEPVSTNYATSAPVSVPLIVRIGSGRIQYLEAYRKADGRLLIQAFDKADNAADDSGLTYTVTGGKAEPFVLPATPGCEVTEVMLPASLRDCGEINVADNTGRHCRSTPLPRSIDGRQVVFGDVHTHTGFSDGDYPIEDAIAWARSRVGLDFTGPGDHISQEGEFAGLTTADYARFGRKFEETGKFCRLPALETSCGGGHQIVCARDFDTFVKFMSDYVKQVGPKADMMDSAAFYQAVTAIMPAGKAMIVPAHALGSAGRWPDIPDKSRVGAGQAFYGGTSHESHESETNLPSPPVGATRWSSIRNALATGYKLGFVGDSDAHRCLPGQPMEKMHGMTAVQVKQLDTASVFDGIRDRRCYGTSGARIVADATLNNAPIGSELKIAPTQPRNFKIVINGTAPIAETQIIHCGKVLTAFPADGKAYDIAIEWTDTPPATREVPKHEYYYVRVRQTDGHAACLSPFWIVAP